MMFRRGKKSLRKMERGVTLLVTVVSMIPLLGMAALAIDVVTLYSASGEAQKAADAGALAGAKEFVTSGFTSGQLGDPTQGSSQNLACNGSTGDSDLQAKAAAQQNIIAGGAPTTITTSCNFTTPENPSITVTVTKTGLPTFFARIWGAGASTARAVATAEAYNPSGTGVPIQIANVKPWLIPNCDPTTMPPPAASPPPCVNGFFVDSRTNYGLSNPSFYIGQYFTFTQTKTPITGGYYAIDLPQATVCPSPSALPVNSCQYLGSSVYHDNIACFNPAQMTCGSTVTVNNLDGTAAMGTSTLEGTQCLIHTTANGNSKNSCAIDPNPDCFKNTGGGPPITVDGGQQNPNPSMRVANISRSDSIVTVPIFDFKKLADDPCPGGTCSGKLVTIVGFLQMGIQHVSAAGVIKGYILNASGCDPADAGSAVSGGGVSPIPVRLVQ